MNGCSSFEEKALSGICVTEGGITYATDFNEAARAADWILKNRK